MKRALITGITGQDGAYLAQLLLGKNYQVFGLFPHRSHDTEWRLRELGIADKVISLHGDLTDDGSLRKAIKTSAPDQIYNLAAQSFVMNSFESPEVTADVNALGTLRLLESVKELAPNARFYQASSSEMFGNSKEDKQSELTPFRPRSPYAASKVFAHQMALVYREAYGLWVSCGICFNHESPLRGEEFVTRKISKAVARIKLGKQSSLSLGNIKAVRDWGFSGDYVKAMWLALQYKEPRTFVIATGQSESVENFAKAAFAHAVLSAKQYIVQDESLARPADVYNLCGDAGRARGLLGWQPMVNVSQLASMMVDADLQRESLRV